MPSEYRLRRRVQFYETGMTGIATDTLTIVCVSQRPNEPMKSISIPPHITARFQGAAGAGA